MKTELLVKLAEILGWTDVYPVEGVYPIVLGVPPDCSMEEEFNPEENSEQLLEVIGLIIDKYNFSIHAGFDDSIRVLKPSTRIQSEAKTITKAVMKAVEALMEDEQ